jgi:glycerol transport system ATP-binding protein
MQTSRSEKSGDSSRAPGRASSGDSTRSPERSPTDGNARTPERASTQFLKLEGVTRIVEGETHLHPIDLEFAPGSFTSLLGHTRAGKTTLLRVIAGLDAPSSGRIRWGLDDITKLHVRERGVAMVYQQFINYPSLTVYENIASPLRVQKRESAAIIDRRVREMAESLGLTPLLGRLPAELSGGQQQRTAIARALVKDAKLVLLDEPLANLDYKLREELRAQLRELLERRGATAVYATAEPDEALLLGGRTVVLDEGRVLQSGPALSVYVHPNNQRVAQVFSDPQLNLLDLEVIAKGKGRLGGADNVPLAPPLSALAPGRYRLGVRANQLELARSSPEDLRLATTLLIDEVTGSATLLHVACGDAALTARLPGVQRRALGSSVELFVRPERVFVFDLEGRLIEPAVVS